MRLKKFCIVSWNLGAQYKAGEITTVVNWVRSLRSLGADIKLINLRNRLFDSVIIDKLKILKGLTQTKDFDLVHLIDVGSISYIPLFIFLKAEQRKLVYSMSHGSLTRWTLLNTPLFDAITVTSKRMLLKFRKYTSIFRKTWVIPPCVDTGLFSPRDKWKVRDELGLPRDWFLMFALGHFKAERRLLPFIEIVNRINYTKKNVGLMIGWTGIGDRDIAKQIISITKKRHNIKVIPPTPHIHLYYNAADVYVLTSSSSGVIEVPISILESLSSGTPVVAFDTNAVREIVKDGINGYIIRDGDFDEMEEKLKSLVNEPSVAVRLGTNGRNHVISKFSYRVIGHRILDLYRVVADCNSQVG